MSISKEERERLEQASQEVRQGFVEAREIDGLIGYYGFMDRDDVEACAEGVPALFRTLDGKDEQIADLQRENQRLGQSLANIVISNEPPTEADIQRAHELVERGLIDGG